MILLKRSWAVTALGAVVGAFAFVSTASAAVTTEETGSILVFPKVVWDGSRDTVIQITNTGNGMAHLLCFYIDGSERGVWNEIDFEIWLTKQQPTHWVASSGRRVDFTDGFGTDGAGFDPGLVPPVQVGFQGELKCLQVDTSGAPLRSNKVKGTAVLLRGDSDASRYNAIAIPGNPDMQVGNMDNELLLNNIEYDACPDTLALNHFAEGVNDPVVEDLGTCSPDCPISTYLTLVPCGQDLENAQPGEVTVQFRIFDELERSFSSSTTVDCWLTQPLSAFGNVFEAPVLESLSAHTRINPVEGHGAVIGVAEELRTDGGDTAWAAFNIHFEGDRHDTAQDLDDDPVPGVLDRIVVPLHN